MTAGLSRACLDIIVPKNPFREDQTMNHGALNPKIKELLHSYFGHVRKQKNGYISLRSIAPVIYREFKKT